MRWYVRQINRLNEWVGTYLSFLLVPMIVSIAYEVIARYFFNSPTDWAVPLSTYLLCTYALLGGGYTLLKGGHVNVDIVYGRFSIRTKAIIACFTSVFAFIFLGVLIWKGGRLALNSFMMKETVGGVLTWPFYPVKATVPLGALLFLLQFLARFFNDLSTAFTGKPLEADKAKGIFGGAGHK